MKSCKFAGWKTRIVAESWNLPGDHDVKISTSIWSPFSLPLPEEQIPKRVSIDKRARAESRKFNPGDAENIVRKRRWKPSEKEKRLKQK